MSRPQWLTGNMFRGWMATVSAALNNTRTAVGILACLLAGCATNHALMPTPAVYTGPNAKPLFADASIDSRPSPLDLLYLTDRAPGDGVESLYTAERSRSIAFGSTTIEFTEGETLTLGATTELGHFPPIPYPLTPTPKACGVHPQS